MNAPAVNPLGAASAALWLLCLTSLAGQVQPRDRSGPAAFDVASIRVNDRSDAPASSSVLPGGRYVAVNVTLRDLVRSAYDVSDAEIVGGASWTRQRRFDVQARAEADWPVDQFRTAMRPMLRQLLAERFGLKTHQERRVIAVYALERTRKGRLGPQLHPVGRECISGSPCGVGFNRRGAMSGKSIAFSALVKSLSTWSDRPIVDRTGLSGLFDWDLTWDPDSAIASSDQKTAASPVVVTNGVSLFTAVREQLGVALRPTRAEVPVRMIDDAVMPMPDEP